MNPIYTYFAVAFLLAMLYEEMVVCGMKRKNFRKSNHIAHFMGKRTENDIDEEFPYVNFPNNEIEAGNPYPYQNEAMGYPAFLNGPLVPLDDVPEDKYPFRRDALPIAHILGRQLPYGERDFDDSVRDELGFPKLLEYESGLNEDDVQQGNGGDRTVLDVLLRAAPLQRERLLDYMDTLFKDTIKTRRK